MRLARSGGKLQVRAGDVTVAGHVGAVSLLAGELVVGAARRAVLDQRTVWKGPADLWWKRPDAMFALAEACLARGLVHDARDLAYLAIVETLVDGFRTLPVGTSGFGTDGLWTVIGWGSQLFAGALMVALPGITALLIVNLAFGAISRAAPSLNLFAVGFPITLVFGLVIIIVGLPALQTSFMDLMRDALALMRTLLHAGG